MNEIISRKKLEHAFKETRHYPLSLAVAPMGYGKTIGALTYLKNEAIDYIWLSLEFEQTDNQSIWETACRQLKKVNGNLAKKLDLLGFPEDIKHYNYLLENLMALLENKKITLVIDDYHFCLSKEVDQLLYKLSSSALDNLHILILSRTLPRFNVEELKLKDKCYVIKPELFIFDKPEVARYFRRRKIKASTEVIDKVHQLSEGWVSAVRLIAEKYHLTGNLDNILSLDRLIKDTIISKYDDTELAILGQFSIFDNFTLDQVSEVLGIQEEIFVKLLKGNAFIRYDEKNEDYKVHNIFSKYLRKYYLDKLANKNDLYINNGHWHVDNGQTVDGIQNYLHAQAYQLILDEVAKNKFVELFVRHRQFMYKIYKTIPEEMMLATPYACLNFASYLITIINPIEGGQLLKKLMYFIEEDADMEVSLKNKIKGDIYHLTAILQYNDIEKMAQTIKVAYQLLEGQSNLCDMKKQGSLSSISILYSYYTKAGYLKEHIESMCENFTYYMAISNGCGQGMIELVRAEYALESLDIDTARLYAEKALYKAQEGQQLDVILLAAYNLSKIKLYTNEFGEALKIMLGLPELESILLHPTTASQYEICLSHIYFSMEKHEMMTPWIRTGDFDKSKIYPISIGLNYIIYGKALLLEQAYIKLEHMCQKMTDLMAQYHYLLGTIHQQILLAIAQYHIYGKETFHVPLDKAIKIAEQDGLYMIFIEYGHHLLPVLKAYTKQSDFTEKLINELEVKQGKVSGHYIELTDRELEIIELLIQGKSNKEIGDSLYVAEVTVKKMLSGIYKKYDVKNRVEFLLKY